MAMHKERSRRTGVAVHLCDPHRPRQRSSNKNTTGLVRQYLPRGGDLSANNQEQPDTIPSKLSARPRQGLGVRSPTAAERKLLINSLQLNTLIH